MSTQNEVKILVGYWLKDVWDHCKSNDLLNAEDYIDQWDFREAELFPLDMVNAEDESFIGFELPIQFNMDTKGKWYQSAEQFAFDFQKLTLCEPLVRACIFSY
jgi:hypothetical protein